MNQGGTVIKLVKAFSPLRSIVLIVEAEVGKAFLF